MHIKVICDDTELKKIDAIQDAFTPIMRSLSKLGLCGDIEIGTNKVLYDNKPIQKVLEGL